MAGRSMLSKVERRQPSSFWKGRELSSSRSSAIASFSAARLKNLRLRSRARIHRCAMSTPASTFALSRGLPGLGRLEPVALCFDVDDLGAMDEPVDEGHDAGRVREDLARLGKFRADA